MILIVCDHKKRELKTQKKLVEYLKKKNLPCKIVNKHLILKYYNYFKPKIIIFPHTNGYLAKTIDLLGKKVIKILMPTEHCAFVDKFIEMHYLNNYKKDNQNSLGSIDYIFCQSEHIKKKLLQKTNITKEKIFSLGHLYYSNWINKKKPKKKKIKNIGIALTNEFIMRKFKSKNVLKDYYELDKEENLFQNNWRIGQLGFDLYFFSLLFKLTKELKKYNINIRTHVVDKESDFKFLKNHNVKIDAHSNLKQWLDDQDLIISCISFINVDAYIYKKPHISLIKMIPNEFFFNAYNNYTYKEFPELNSYKPKNLEELFKIIKKIKFKKSAKMDFHLKKYFSFPYKINPLEEATNIIMDKYHKDNIKKHKPIFSSGDKKLINFFGKKIGILISIYFSQIKHIFHKSSKNMYFDFKFLIK